MTGLAVRRFRKSQLLIAATPTSSRNDLGPLHAAERRQLLALQAAAYAALRRSGHGVAARARAEVAIAFAHRWAVIRRLPSALRVAAAAALEAEQTAVLSARTTYLLQELHAQNRTERSQLRFLFAAQRKALTSRHRDARAAKRSADATSFPSQRTSTYLASHLRFDY